MFSLFHSMHILLLQPGQRLLVNLMIIIITVVHSGLMYSNEITLNQKSYNSCNKSEYFSVHNFKCMRCDASKNLLPSIDKLSCVCNNFSRQVKWSKEGIPICIACESGELVTSDGRFCLPCPSPSQGSNSNKTIDSKARLCKPCSSGEIFVERGVNGSLLAASQCVPCAPGSLPSLDGATCVPCEILNSVNTTCSCPSSRELVGADVCASSIELTSWPDLPSTYTIDFPITDVSLQSKLLQDNLRRNVYLCKSLRRTESCEAVANMCALTRHRDGPACILFRDPRDPRAPEPSPWLFYGEGDAPTVLNRRKIHTRYSLDPYSKLRQLNLTVSWWAVNGSWLGSGALRPSTLQLCPGPPASLDAAFRFGANYRHSCQLPVSHLATSPIRNRLLHLYLRFNDSLYAVPTLDTGLQQGSRYPNKESDVGQWQLTRRFFIVDSVSGVTVNGSKVQVLQYLKTATLRIRAQHGENQGKIYPPLLILKYGEVTAKDIEADKSVYTSFSVEYFIDSRITYTIDIWLGVVCGLAVVWSALQTWSHCKRSAHLTIDLLTLFHLCVIAAGHLSNVFFTVVGLAAIHNLVYYKGQSVVQVLSPTTTLDGYVHTYVIVSFCLKLVEIGSLVWQQLSVDIFLIDWERPRATKDNSQPVSIWRTYFVANEWNEIQSERKTSLTVQLITTVLLIKVCGLEHWAVTDPDLNNVLSPEMLYRPPNFTLQFAVAFLVYLFVYVSQWLVFSAVYERYIKFGIQEFVDVCSLANISVFILSLENFGYYIHGRSAHGFADTDMQSIMNQLMREEEDLVGHRGLLPASDHQTFLMYIPNQLRSYYKRLMPPTPSQTKQLSALRTKLSGQSTADFDRSIAAYHNMNKFLAAFLEHALRDLDYEVRDKLFAEALLDIEFSDVPGKAVFYIDNGHSFDKVLFYGNELTLFSMDLMTFCFFQVVTGDFLLAAIITALIAKVLIVIRHIGGRKNLAKKTLIDERFLI